MKSAANQLDFWERQSNSMNPMLKVYYKNVIIQGLLYLAEYVSPVFYIIGERRTRVYKNNCINHE